MLVIGRFSYIQFAGDLPALLPLGKEEKYLPFPGGKLFYQEKDAGEKLSILLGRYMRRPGINVVTFTASGIPTAREVASALKSPMTMLHTERIVVGGSDEIELGALAENDVTVMDEQAMKISSVPDFVFDEAVNTARGRLAEKMILFRRKQINIKNTVVILTSDAVLSSMRVQAAVLSLKKYNPFQIVLAVPLISEHDYDELKNIVNDIVYIKKVTSSDELKSIYDKMPIFKYDTAPQILEQGK